MKKFIISVCLILTLVLPLFSFEVTAETRTEVYTRFVHGNFNHSGDGSFESPYNLFEDAMKAVADGGTIYIMDGGAFINDTSDGIPFTIDKNITIAAQPNAATYPELDNRTWGMVLGADVTFKNIELAFSNAMRPIVCANGYNLVMENVSYNKSTRKIHLAGGGMYSKNGVSVSPEAGEHGSITVRGSKTLFGNIYAGSINSDFDRPVDISVYDVSGANIGNIYASGAEEGYYNSENFLDPDNEPEDPVSNPINYPVYGNVSVNLNQTSLREVYGNTGGLTNAAVTFFESDKYLSSCSLTDISSLDVKTGHFAPNAMNDGADVTVRDGAIFDISQLNSNFEVNNFEGGGTLILSEDGHVNINGQCSGETELRIAGGTTAYSGIAQYNHMYVKTEGDGTFSFHPYPTQSDMTLEKRDGGWWTSQQSETVIALKSFDISDKLIYTTASDINSYKLPPIQVTAEFTENSLFDEIGMIPLEYSVMYKGEKFISTSTPLEDYEGYFEGDIKELNMNFTPIGDEITISNFSSSLKLGEIAEGTYEIEITAPTVTGNVTRSLVLVVRDTIPETREQFDVTFEDGKAEVIFTNTDEKQIDNAVMILCVYDNGIVKTVKPADDRITLKSGETQVVHFDIDGIDHNKLKIMIWDNIEKMTPVCDYYEKSMDI